MTNNRPLETDSDAGLIQSRPKSKPFSLDRPEGRVSIKSKSKSKSKAWPSPHVSLPLRSLAFTGLHWPHQIPPRSHNRRQQQRHPDLIDEIDRMLHVSIRYVSMTGRAMTAAAVAAAEEEEKEGFGDPHRLFLCFCIPYVSQRQDLQAAVLVSPHSEGFREAYEMVCEPPFVTRDRQMRQLQLQDDIVIGIVGLDSRGGMSACMCVLGWWLAPSGPFGHFFFGVQSCQRNRDELK